MLYRAYKEKYYEKVGDTFKRIRFELVKKGLFDNLLERSYSIHHKIVDSRVVNNFKETGNIDLNLSNTESKGRFIKIIDKSKDAYRFILYHKPEKLFKVYEGHRFIYKGVVSENEYYSLDKRLYIFKEIKDETIRNPTFLKIKDKYTPFFSLSDFSNVYISKNGGLVNKKDITDKQKCYVDMHQEAMSLLYSNI